MIGSAVQNFITLTDTFFLGRVGKIELGAIGLVGVFYLMITSIGYSFSKAGQIMIARRVGENQEYMIGSITYSMVAFAMFLATFLFVFMQFGSPYFFGLFVNNADILQACIDYLSYRSFGVFFSYFGVIMLALYTGVARTKVIIYNAMALGIVNTILNYGLIFGVWGFPEMGIAGAGLASFIAEVASVAVFIIYILFDKKARDYKLFDFPRIDLSSKGNEISDLNDTSINLNIIKRQLSLSTPIVLQSVVGMGSWFIFFIIVEDMGTDELAISNIIRTVYLFFMIPCWGFSSGINTIVSNLIGQNRSNMVFKATLKTSLICFFSTSFLIIVMLLFPDVILSIGTDNVYLLNKAIDLSYILAVILIAFSFGAIFFNGLIGTGATKQALQLQTLSCMIYLGYIYVIVHVVEAGLHAAWLSELIYWICCLIFSFYFLRKGNWLKVQV